MAEREAKKLDAARKAAQSKSPQTRSNAAKKAADTKGAAERSREARAANWTRKHGKNDAVNPHAKQNEGGERE
jgi:hypothetical protein